MELSVEQVLLVGFIASVITQLLKFLADKFNFKMGQEVVNVILFVVAVGLGFLWMRPEIPVGGDPMELAKVLLEAALGVVGFAGLIYNILLAKIIYPRIAFLRA